MHVKVWLLDLVELASYSDVLLERDWSVFLKSLFLGCLAKCSSILVVRVFWETDAYDWSTSEIFAARRACLENGSDVSSAAEIGH